MDFLVTCYPNGMLCMLRGSQRMEQTFYPFLFPAHSEVVVYSEGWVGVAELLFPGCEWKNGFV